MTPVVNNTHDAVTQARIHCIHTHLAAELHVWLHRADPDAEISRLLPQQWVESQFGRQGTGHVGQAEILQTTLVDLLTRPVMIEARDAASPRHVWLSHWESGGSDRRARDRRPSAMLHNFRRSLRERGGNIATALHWLQNFFAKATFKSMRKNQNSWSIRLAKRLIKEGS